MCSAASSTTSATSACAWRLAADLAARGESVRLWSTTRARCAWMAPRRRTRRRGRWRWHDAAAATARDVVSRPSAATRRRRFVGRMAAAPRRRCWINLEYLSAEPYVERIARPALAAAAAPARGLTKWFFYPGLHAGAPAACCASPACSSAGARFDAATPGCASHGIAPRAGERWSACSATRNAARRRLLDALPTQPTLLLAARRCRRASRSPRCLGPAPRAARLRAVPLPCSAQPDYDRLLWACDLNFVRGEDSFVRAHLGRRAVRLAALPAGRRRARAPSSTPSSTLSSPARRRAGGRVRRLFARLERRCGAAGAAAGPQAPLAPPGARTARLA